LILSCKTNGGTSWIIVTAKVHLRGSEGSFVRWGFVMGIPVAFSLHPQ
jgi:hypothetical protein